MSFFNANSSIRVSSLANWLDMAAGLHPDFRVVLPMIQRGFVWKPRQIIDLWDSVLSGMPIGTFMVSEMQAQDAFSEMQNQDGWVSSPATAQAAQHQLLGLVDGQQRSLALLMGWTAFSAKGQAKHRLWVDLADTPAPGHLVRLRVTTTNQPFGYRRDDPNGKLSLDQRRCAKAAHTHLPQGELLAYASPHPAGATHSAPLDFGHLVEWARAMDAEAWKRKVHQVLASIQPDLPDELHETIALRIQALADGLQRVFAAEIPLLRIDPAFFKVAHADDVEPPLARLLQRIGSNATPLSDADYIYSVLKHLMPEVHTMVEALHASRQVAGFLTATDLVMSALRLAATHWDGTRDLDNPSKEDFHRMVIRPEKDSSHQRTAQLQALLATDGAQTLGHYFNIVQDNLLYRGPGDHGLPSLMFPYLGRPLVQVLLRLAQAGFLQSPVNEALRAQALRLALWWMTWVGDKPKASRIAFETIRQSTEAAGIDYRVAQAIVEEGAGWGMQAPAAIQALGLHDSAQQQTLPLIQGQSRFATPQNDVEMNRLTREFYRQWWQPWHYQHAMLLWLQRDYTNILNVDTQAGMADDTPYDFDHILPHAHWGGWDRGGKGSRLIDYLTDGNGDAHTVLGNSIGNVRVWDAAHNRSDGDASPQAKLQAAEEPAQWLASSAINPLHEPHWLACSPAAEAEKRFWDMPRAMAFQRAVEYRAFDLYLRLFEDAGFGHWIGQAGDAEVSL